MVGPAPGDAICGFFPLLDPDGNTIFWYVGDTLTQEFIIYNKNGDPVDVTGKTMNAKMVKDLQDGSFVYFDTLLVIVTALEGKVSLALASGDLIDEGEFILEVYEVAPKITLAKYKVVVHGSVV